ncbi:AAA family ATPase [Paenibacillus polymyxa]|uniref:AAA family ATPase n=1 Tax=Paenibacillus polymyxa TaxID=1406 RepID=UPI002ED0E6F1
MFKRCFQEKVAKEEGRMNRMNNKIDGLKGTHVLAKYNEQINPKNIGNPFIEALPDRTDLETFIDVLSSSPPRDKKFNNLSSEDRLEFVQQIRPDFWLPLPTHFEKYLNLYTMIKIGYQSRNPLHAMYNRQFSIGWDEIFKAGVDENGANLAGNIQTAQSHVEIAINGFGKSQLYERMLTQLFPQVIHHSEYDGRNIPLTQVVWIKVECPYNKSVGTFCKVFYMEVDKLLGTNFYEKFGEKPGKIDKLVLNMIKVAAQINLGVLIIDEIQKIQSAYSGGKDNMIDFITQLVNTIGIPTILMGSFKALYLFKDSLANTRRGIPSGYSESISGYMLEDSWEWNEFIENLWDIQYTKKYTELTPKLKKAMYYYSLGIPDITVKLFIHCQSKCIVMGGNEQISITCIKEVAERSLRLVQSIFDRIRSGDPEAYKDLEDIKPDWVPLNGYISEVSHRIQVHGSIAEEHARILQRKDKTEVLKKLTEFAIVLVQSPSTAEELAYRVYDASKGMGDLTGMFVQIAELALQGEKSEKVAKKIKIASELPKKLRTKKVSPDMSEDDIRFVVQIGHKKELTTEEALEEKGYIREADEILSYIK